MQIAHAYSDQGDDRGIVALAVDYFKRFKDTEITPLTLVRALTTGRAINWQTGALFSPRVGLLPAEQNFGFEDREEAMTAMFDMDNPINVGVLIEAGISFSIRGRRTQFVQEFVQTKVSTEQHPNGFQMSVLGELRGCRAMKTGTGGEMSEPLTFLEAAHFIVLAMLNREPKETAESFWERGWDFIGTWATQLVSKYNTQRARIHIMLEEALHVYDAFAASIEQHNAKQQRTEGTDFRSPLIGKLVYLQPRKENQRWSKEGKSTDLPAVLAYDRVRKRAIREAKSLLRRARASLRRHDVGSAWSTYQQWMIGNREGIIHDRYYMNDETIRRGDQGHMPGERIDGQLLLQEALDESRGMSCFSQMYTTFYLDSKTEEKKAVFAPDKGPVNRGWTERSIYLLRQELRRDEYFAEKLWRFLTWPLELLTPAFERINGEYVESTKAAAPGPGRKQFSKLTAQERKDLLSLGWLYSESRPEGSWVNVPLYREQAINWLRAQPNLGRLAGKPYDPEKLRVVKGENWHTTLLRREQLDALRQALEFRKSRKIAGLPLEYVDARY